MAASIVALVVALCITATAWAQERQPIVELPPETATAAPIEINEFRLPPDKLRKSEALYTTGLILYAVGTLYGLAVLIGVLWLRVSARFRDLAERASAQRFVQAIVFVPLLSLTMDVLSLPFGIYRHRLQAEYGLSVQSFGSWIWDWTKGELIGTALVTLLVWGLYAILRRSATRWWLYGWLASVPVMFFIVLLEPIVIAPLFNTFEPLEARQPELVADLERVMQRGGLDIERSRMFEMRASDKLTTYNAYVSGIGASKRVVVWDNTSRDLTRSETLFVFGHEQGHYVLHHIWWSLGFAVGGLLVGMYLAYRSVDGLIARFGVRWGVRGVADWASLPVLLLLFSLFAVASEPIAAGFQRYLEHDADIYGLEVIHGLVPDSSQIAAQAFQKLGEKGLRYPYPHPLYVFWTYSHPPIGDRVRFALDYRPWDEGKPLQFFGE